MSSTLTDRSAFSLSLAGSRSPVLAASTMCWAMRSRTTSLWQGCGSDLHESSNAAPMARVTSSSNEPAWIELQIINLCHPARLGAGTVLSGSDAQGCFGGARLGLAPDQDCSKQTDCPGLFGGGSPAGADIPEIGCESHQFDGFQRGLSHGFLCPEAYIGGHHLMRPDGRPW